MAPPKRRQIFQWVLIYFFWFGVLSQVIFGGRDDYPFSFFGMYRYSNIGPAQRIRIEWGDRFNLYNCIGYVRFSLRQKLHESVMLEKRDRARKKILSRKKIWKGEKPRIEKNELRQISLEFLKHAREKKLCKIPDQKISVKITVQAWKNLSSQIYFSPDYSYEVFNEEI